MEYRYKILLEQVIRLRVKKKILIILVLAALMIFSFILMSKKIMNSVWYKMQWNINFPFVESYYTVDDMWESYNVYSCSENDIKVLKTSLYKQIPTKYWEEEMIGHLENMNIDPVMYPSFSEINYCIRRQKGDAELIMLMSSSQDMLYVYTCTR